MKPCPFCGGTAPRHLSVRKTLREGCEDGEVDAYAYNVFCGSCAAEGPWNKTSEAAAVKAWNGLRGTPRGDEPEEEPREEYDFTDGERGKYVDRYYRKRTPEPMARERLILEFGFMHGLTIDVVVATPPLRMAGGMGFPGHILKDLHGVRLRFGSDVHKQMQVEFFDELMECNLSFDDLYRVQIPYAVIGDVSFRFGIEEWVPKKKPPSLQLVE